MVTNSKSSSALVEAVFSPDVARFINRVGEFYGSGSGEFGFWAPYTREKIRSLEELAASLSVLSAAQDDVMAMLSLFSGLPESVHLPIEQAQLIKYAAEAIKLAQNRGSVYTFLQGMHQSGHESHYVPLNGINATLERLDGIVALAEAGNQAIELLNDFRRRRIEFRTHYEGGIYRFPDRVLQFSGRKQDIFMLLDDLAAIGYEGVGRMPNPHISVNELSFLAANKGSVLPFLEALGKIGAGFTPHNLVQSAEDIVRLAEKGYAVSGFIHEFRIAQKQYEAEHSIAHRESGNLDYALRAKDTLLLFAERGQQINAAVRAIMGVGVQVDLDTLFRYKGETLMLADGHEAVARLAEALKPLSSGYEGSLYFALERGQAKGIVELGMHADFMLSFAAALAAKNIHIQLDHLLSYATELVPVARRVGQSESGLNKLVENVRTHASVDYSSYRKPEGAEYRRLRISVPELVNAR